LPSTMVRCSMLEGSVEDRVAWEASMDAQDYLRLLEWRAACLDSSTRAAGIS
jgi:hypothetical protein